jgi:hypothetical protein
VDVEAHLIDDAAREQGLGQLSAAHQTDALALIDLTDPEFRARLVVQARATRAGLQSLVVAAIAARELRKDTDARALARTLEAVLSGSLLTWGFYREGTAARWLREDLELAVAPYVRKRWK